MRGDLGGEPWLDVVVAQHHHRAGLLVEVAAVEDEDAARGRDEVHQIKAQRAAVLDAHLRPVLIEPVKVFDAARPEPLVGPEDVADAEHEHFASVV